MTRGKNKANVLRVPVDRIVADHLYQMRAKGVDDAVATQYAVLLRQGVDLCAGADRPIAFADDDGAFHLGDGFHRLKAHRLAGHETMSCEVRSGGPRDAWLHALGANGSHGVPRSRADVRKAIGEALDDKELAEKSDRELAGILNVSHTTIANHRRRRKEATNPTPANDDATPAVDAVTTEGPNHQYGIGHPWHYYAEGDGADPLPVEEIRGTGTTTVKLDLPKDQAKRDRKLEQLHDQYATSLEKDRARYTELIDKGFDALSRFDRQHDNAALSWASAVAAKVNHIRYQLNHLAAVEEAGGPKFAPEQVTPRSEGPTPPTEKNVADLRQQYPSHVLLFDQPSNQLVASGVDDAGVLHRILRLDVGEDEFDEPIATIMSADRRASIAKLIRNDCRVMIVDAEDLAARTIVNIDHPYHPDYDPNQTTIDQVVTPKPELTTGGKVATDLADGPLRSAWAGTSTAEVIDLLGGEKSETVTALDNANVIGFVTDVEARYFARMTEANQASLLTAIKYGEGPTLMAACGRVEDECYAHDRLKKAEVQFVAQEYRDRMWQYRHDLRVAITRELATRPSVAAGVFAAEGGATIRGLVHEQDGSTGIWRPLIEREVAVLRAAVAGVASGSGAIEADATEACAQGDALHTLGDCPLGVLLHLADLLGLEVPELPSLRGIVDETINANPQAAKTSGRKKPAAAKPNKSPAKKPTRKAANTAA